MMPGGGHNNPLEDSCLENPVDQGAWRAIVHRVTQSQTQLKWLSMHTSEWWLLLWRRKLIGKMHRKLSRVMTIFPVANVCQKSIKPPQKIWLFYCMPLYLNQKICFEAVQTEIPCTINYQCLLSFHTQLPDMSTIDDTNNYCLLNTCTMFPLGGTPKLWVTTWLIHPFHKCLFSAWCVCQVPFLVLGICQGTEETRKQFLIHWA